MIIPNELKSAINNDNLIIFAGAGLSRQFGFPDWKGLVQNIIKRINNDNLEGMIQGVEAGWFTPIEALDKLKDNYHTEILTEISTCFKLNGSSNLEKHKKLTKLSSKIITTNYDKSFELANEGVDVVHYSSTFNVSQLQGKDKFLFKIHGCVDYPDNCILYSEQYINHYKTDSTSIFELKKIISQNTILFVGFSMTDPFVKDVFSFINNIYKGHSKTHYVLTTEKGIEKEINIPTIKEFVIENYNEDFDKVLNKLIDFKPKIKPRLEEKTQTENEIPKLCILSPFPIDKDIEYNKQEIANYFNKYDVIVDIEYFSIEKLRELNNYDYLLIFTYSVKNKVMCEDEFLKSNYITLKEIEDNIGCNNIKSISVFYSGAELNVDDEGLSAPFILINPDGQKFKTVFTNYVFKLFTKGNLSTVKDTFHCTSENFPIETLSKGKSIINSHKPVISKYIDQKQLNRFIGRKTDLENIIRKVIENQFNSNLLTVKGSGGIGKTTIICKAAIELAKRKHFKNGIHFIACNATTTLDNFQYQISRCFDLASSIELKEQVEDNISDKSRLIILDNFETLLHSNDKESILDLVTFIFDYATVVVTTRQILDLEFEDIYELRNFTTDEGVLLFKSYYGSIKPDQEKVLREHIVERILNNNPLAIKLIAKGLIKSKDLFQLKEELDDKIFQDEDIEKIFERPEDYNIEKSNSLYHSINYSYQQLTDKERLTFELLSLFPDGIHLENFRLFIKQSKKNKNRIGDKEIKSLDDKSLLETSNSFLKLQSIISRFADYQFSRKDETIKKEYYSLAFEYNNYFFHFLKSQKIKTNLANRILFENTNNYLKIIDNLDLVNFTNEEKLLFVNDSVDILRNTNQWNEIVKRSDYLYDCFKDVEDGKLFITVLLAFSEYWTADFNDPIRTVEEIVPLSSINQDSFSNNIKEEIAHTALVMYAHEGYQYEVVDIIFNFKNTLTSATNFLFQLGYVKEIIEIQDLTHENSLFALESKLERGVLKENEIDNYFRTIPPKDTLEIVQITYVKLKFTGEIERKDIKKLVITNPYTKGIISLMYAIIESDCEEKRMYFLEAISALEHIKYYYVEAILTFCKFLKELEDVDYEYWYNKGLDLAKKHKYRLQIHRYNVLHDGVEREYNQNDYEQILPYEKVIEYVNWKKNKK